MSKTSRNAWNEMAAVVAMPLAITVASVLAGFWAIYVTLGPGDNAAEQARGAATTVEKATAGKLNTGQVAGFVFKKVPEALPEIAFTDAKGEARTLKDWQGRVVLLNLWATWCAPCRKEMPGLARLQKELGSAKFEVVALAVDRAGAQAAAKFLGSIEAKELALYVDATARSGTTLRAVGMPTTLLIDGQGREIGRLTGPAEWDSAEAKRLVQAYLK